MADTMETRTPTRDGLARTISVVGLSIGQVADELQQAAERLVMAEEQARDADLRISAAEEQVAQGAAKTAELLAMLQTAREHQTEAEERVRGAERRADATTERAHLLEQQVQELQARVEAAEAKPNVTVILDDERTALQEALAAEVRRPLTSILGITLALKHTDSKSPDGREMVRQLSTHARKLDRLVGEMLDIDRIATGTFTPNLRRTDLEALVRRVVEESADLANRDVKVKTDHVAIQVDPALTEQIVESLLSNAGRRTVPGSAVWVTVSSDEGGAVIAVDDAGTEVPGGSRDLMPLSAVRDAGTPSARGATGLALLARLTEIHGGRCWVEERQGGGTSFRVFLPDTASHGRAEPAEDERPEVAVATEHTEVRTRPPVRERPGLDERALALARALREPVDDEELAI